MIMPWYYALPFMIVLTIWAWYSTAPKTYEFDLTQIKDGEDLEVALLDLNAGIYESKPVVIVLARVLDAGHPNTVRRDIFDTYPNLDIIYTWEKGEAK